MWHLQVKCPYSGKLHHFKTLPEQTRQQVLTELAVLRSHPHSSKVCATSLMLVSLLSMSHTVCQHSMQRLNGSMSLVGHDPKSTTFERWKCLKAVQRPAVWALDLHGPHRVIRHVSKSQYDSVLWLARVVNVRRPRIQCCRLNPPECLYGSVNHRSRCKLEHAVKQACGSTCWQCQVSSCGTTPSRPLLI